MYFGLVIWAIFLHGTRAVEVHGTYSIDTFQDFLIAEHIKPRMHILEISISTLNHVIIRPTKTAKSAVKKFAQIY